MRMMDKLVLFLYLIVLTSFSILLIVIPFGGISYDVIQNTVYGILFTYKWYCLAAGIILTILNISLIMGILLGDRTKKFGIVKYTSQGEINVSYDTIKSLVYRTASSIRGIKDINVMIRPGKENINILIKILILPEINIPETVKEIQESVKTYIERIAEIPVGEIKVVVKDIASSTKLRVE